MPDQSVLIEIIQIPDDINKFKILTDYAVDTRYPGIYEPVSEEE